MSIPNDGGWEGPLFTYVKTCERGRVKDFERVYNAVCYNGVAV